MLDIHNLSFFCLSTISAYEHAVRAAGTDFRSDRLWETFINWETEQQKLANVTAIYDRILGIPTQLYSQHFQRCVCISVTLYAVLPLRLLSYDPLVRVPSI